MSGESLGATDRVAIVGASLAGLRTAQALRSRGFTGPLTLIGDEPYLPYDRPPLSKQFLAGEWARSRIELISEQPAQLDAEWLLGEPAIGLDTATNTVTRAGGQQITYEALVIATGSRPRTLQHLTTGQSDRIHLLRTVDDSIRLAAHLQGSVVIIGAGFIGSEVSSTALGLGLQVTVVEPQAGPMQRVLGGRVSQWLADRMRASGIELLLDTGVESITATGPENALRLTLSDGSKLKADCLLVSVGAIPNTEWLTDSGLVVGDGVVCDEKLFAAERVVAVGDVARALRPDLGRTVRLEHWTSAVAQAAVAVDNLIHGRAHARPFTDQPYVWSDQFGLRIEVIGLPAVSDTPEVIWGSFDGSRFALAYRQDGRITGILGVNAVKPLLNIRRRLNQQPTLDDDLILAAAS